MENYIVINGKKAELTEEQLEKLGIKIEEDIFNPKVNTMYYSINGSGEVDFECWANDGYDIKCDKVANVCTDKDIMRQRAYHETLDRLLWRFSMQNGMKDLDWKKENQDKFYIHYDHSTDRIGVNVFCSIQPQIIYFISEEIAQEAIDTIVKPFMEEHPDFVW